ncbi:MAG: hypothetical protein R3338_10080, partial [Thermoanaerobaculia bacterium]|nr:hypothetical protein [Thermoanaerobaculia bacterium]
EILYTPHTRPENDFTRLIEADDPVKFWSSYPANIEPPRDNNPFFFNSIRLSNLPSALEEADKWRTTNLGTYVLVVALGFTAVLVVLFMIGPLAIARGRELAEGSTRKYSYLTYFACLGAGFMIVEIALIQKFILFLGHPVYALAVVLFSLLTFSAVGSHLSGRFSDATRLNGLVKVIGGLVALTVIYIFVLPPIFYGLVHLGIGSRIIIAVALMAPLALMMGVPMPTGIRILADAAPGIIPWAWGVNGATSVMGSLAALVIAILTGFNQALLVGAGLYLVGLFLIRRAATIR